MLTSFAVLWLSFKNPTRDKSCASRQNAKYRATLSKKEEIQFWRKQQIKLFVAKQVMMCGYRDVSS
jgi:hypothetical protein